MLPIFKYSFTGFDPVQHVKASGREVDVSPKATREVCVAIKDMLLSDAKKYLEDVVKMKKAVPFRRYKKEGAHRASIIGFHTGKYPVKAAKEVLEVLKNLEVKVEQTLLTTKIKGILPSVKDWAESIWPIIRGTMIGFCLGVLPGGGASLSTYVSYAVEKRVSKNPEKFGKGAFEGVAAPESANNAASSGAFVPLLTLGIPSNPVVAMLFAGLLIHNVTPGPLMLQQRPEVFWGLIASMYIGNVMLLILNLPLIWMWVQVTRVPFRLLFPLIVLFCVIGVYSIDNSVFDIWLMLIFGVVGYLMRKCDYEPAPLVLAYVLGPKMEQAMRQSLIMSGGSFGIFLFRPISGICLAVGAFLLITAYTGYVKKKRSEIIKEEA